MVLLYASWLPTLKPLSAHVLRRVPDLVAGIQNTLEGHAWTYAYIAGDVSLTGVGKARLEVYSTGLFLTWCDWDRDLDYQLQGQFGEEALKVYQTIYRHLHVHLFDHTLKFFPLNAPYVALPAVPQIFEALRHRYLTEILEQERRFDVARSSFLGAAQKAADDILNSRLPSSTSLLSLMTRRANLAEVTQALYACRGAGTFFRAFCSLHGLSPRDGSIESHYDQAYSSMADLASSYDIIVPAQTIQFMMLGLAAAAIIAAFVGPFVAIVGTLGPQLLVVAAATVLLILLYCFLSKQIVRRFRNSTDILLGNVHVSAAEAP